MFKFIRNIFFVIIFTMSTTAYATPPQPSNDNSSARVKFYDFSEQVIDGEIRRPTGTYTNARERARFERLLRLKRSFLPELFGTSQERTFK
jgi:hypothetical protein